MLPVGGIRLVHAHAIFRLVEAVVDPVVADLQAEGVLHFTAKPLAENRVARVQPGHPALVLLLELVAAIGVRQEVREVGKQIEIVIKSVGHDLGLGICVVAMPFGLQAVTLRIAAVGRVQCAEETNQRHGVSGDLIARVPFSVVAAGRDAETIGVSALAVGQKAVEFVIIIRMHPWAVIVIHLSAVQQIARAELLRHAENGAPIAIHAAFHLEEVLRQRLEKFQMGRSSRAIVADVRVIRTFLVIHPLHKLRDDGVHVRVPLAVRVRRQV